MSCRLMPQACQKVPLQLLINCQSVNFPWVVRVIPDDRQQTYTIAYYVYKQLGLNSVAILRANNRYGRFGVAQFRNSSIKLGKPAPIEVNYEPNFDNVNPNFDIQMTRLEEVKPDAVVLWADAEAAGVVVRKIRERGMNCPIFACERIVHPGKGTFHTFTCYSNPARLNVVRPKARILEWAESPHSAHEWERCTFQGDLAVISFRSSHPKFYAQGPL